jgi:uncharacterized damage-inducible protein DinB
MQIGHDEAKFLAGYLAGELEREAATTRAVIGAIPAGQEGYSPDGKSMNALKLAWHIASAEWWFLGCILKGEFRAGGDGGIPETVKSATDVLNWYDANVPPLWQSLRAMSAESLTAELDFFGIWKMAALHYISLTLKHGIHHRGQLSAYLRPMGGKVPGIYGPSGDSQ